MKSKLILLCLIVAMFGIFRTNAQTIETCERTVQLNADLPDAGTNGIWSAITDGATIDNLTLHNTTVMLSSQGTYTFRWTLTDAQGSDLETNHTVHYNMPVAELQTLSGGICSSYSDINAVPSNIGVGKWRVLSGSGTIADISSNLTYVDALSPGSNLLAWTVSYATCKATATVGIFNKLPNAQVQESEVVICENSSAQLHATGGVSYRWDTSVFPTLNINNKLIPNPMITYSSVSSSALISVYVKNEACPNNEVSRSVLLKFRNNPEVATSDDVLFCQGTEGVLLASTGGEKYNWSPTAGLSNPNQRNTLAAPEVTTTYTVLVTDVNGCTATDDVKVTVSNATAPLANAGEDMNICRGDTVQLNATGGENYNWSPVNGLSAVNISNPLASPVITIEYFVTVSNSDGCSDTDNIKVFVDAPIYSFEKSDVSQYGGDDGRIEVFTDEANTINWSNGVQININENLTAGLYRFTITNENDCEITRGVDVRQPHPNDCDVVAQFEYEVTDNNLTLNNTSISANYSLWVFSDGEYMTDIANQSTVRNDITSGVYEVCLIAYESKECIDRSCKRIEIGDVICNAEIGARKNPANPKEVNFTANTKGNITKWYWDFGDGKISTDPNPVHTFTNEGRYYVRLRVLSSANNCIANDLKEVNIGSSHLSSRFISFQDFTSLTPRKIIFANFSMGNVTNYFWNFGDGTTSIEKNPKHFYAKSGIFEVTLVVKNADNGKISSFKAKIQVRGALTYDFLIPDFDFSIDNETKTVQFVDKSLGGATNYFWTFGDGTHSRQKSPLHTYDNEGVYKVMLVVSNITGRKFNKITKDVQIGDRECIAKFDAFVDPSSLEVKFNTSGIGDDIDVNWNFGDASFSDEIEPVHTYAQAGYYKVQLSIANSDRTCTDKYKAMILVGTQANNLKADFTYLTSDKTIQLYNNSTGNPTKYVWNLGTEGGIFTGDETTYTYPEYGVYNVCLTAWEDIMRNNTVCQKIRITPDGGEKGYSSADFDYYVDVANRTVTFTDLSYGDNDTWEWSFGDGNDSGEQHPVHQFTENGFYLVKLIVKNTSSGKLHRTIRLLNVGGENVPKVEFIYSQIATNNKYGGYPVEMAGAAFGDPAKTVWEFGDGEQDSTTTEPIHDYSQPGTYTVCVTVTTATGTTQSCQQVEVVNTSIADYGDIDNNPVTIYPNPVTSTAQISYYLSHAGEAKLEIYDILGSKIHSTNFGNQPEGNHNMEWDSANLPGGVYFIRLYHSDSTYVRYFIIDR